jgi:hypothetical protein
MDIIKSERDFHRFPGRDCPQIPGRDCPQIPEKDCPQITLINTDYFNVRNEE